MSGGHYDYKCFEVSQFAEMVAMTIKERSESRVEQYTPEYSETIEALPKPLLDKMQVFVDVMRKCADMAKDIEWMMSGDTCEESTLRDLHAGLVEIGAIIDRHYESR
jgi:hypothetical protein